MRRLALILLLALVNAGCMTVTDTRSNVRHTERFIPRDNRQGSSELELVIDPTTRTARLMRATTCDGTLEVASHFNDTHQKTPGPIVYVAAALSLVIFSASILDENTDAIGAALVLGPGVTAGSLLLSTSTTKPRTEVRDLQVSGRPCGGWPQAAVQVTIGLSGHAVSSVTDEQGQVALPPRLVLDPEHPPVAFAHGRAIAVRISDEESE